MPDRSIASCAIAASLSLFVSACAMAPGDNTATNEMLRQASELGMPKGEAQQTEQQQSCGDVSQQTTKFQGIARADYSRCRMAANRKQ